MIISNGLHTGLLQLTVSLFYHGRQGGEFPLIFSAKIGFQGSECSRYVFFEITFAFGFAQKRECAQDLKISGEHAIIIA